jgi:hypothetical protein
VRQSAGLRGHALRRQTAWLRALTAAGALALLAACRGEPAGGPLSVKADGQDAVAALQRINEAGVACWMRGGDPAFSELRLVPELDTRVGRPRLLVLQKGKAEGLPVMVIEAGGSPVTVETYGPLAATSTGARMNGDIRRWTGGRTNCA